MPEPMPGNYDNWKTTEPEDPDACPCGNPVKPGSDRCRECLAELRAEANGERI